MWGSEATEPPKECNAFGGFSFASPPASHSIATRVDGTLYYVHGDHLGSTVAVSDAAGQAVGRVQYDPYGEVLTSTLPVTLTDCLFTGQRLDSSTGLYYYNARYYDPHLGRFIQPDSLVPNPLNPQAWNRFSYVYNNPTSYVDPSGHDGILVPLLIFGGAFLLGAGAGGYYAYHQGYGFESWQLYAYAGMGGLAGVAGAATGMWIEAALLPVGATIWQAAAAGAAGGFAAGVVEQSILEVGGAAILGTEVSAERILLAGATGGITGGFSGMASRWLRLRAAGDANPVRLDPNVIGRVGEEATGIAGPKIRIDSLTGTAKYRVPDEVIRPAQILREVKNVARLSYTSQLRDYALFAQTHGYTFELIVRQTTRLSGPLRAAIQRGEIILRYLPW